MNTDDIARALRRQAASVTEDQLRGPGEVRARPSNHRRRHRNSLLAIAAGLVAIAVVTTSILLMRPDSGPLQAQPQPTPDQQVSPRVTGTQASTRVTETQARVEVERGMTFHNDEPQTASGACSKDGYVENAGQLKSKTAIIVLGKVTAVRKDLSVLATTSAPTSNDLGSYTPEVTLLPRILTVSVQQTISGDVRADSAFDMTDVGWTRGQIDDPNWYPLTMPGRRASRTDRRQSSRSRRTQTGPTTSPARALCRWMPAAVSPERQAVTIPWFVRSPASPLPNSSRRSRGSRSPLTSTRAGPPTDRATGRCRARGPTERVRADRPTMVGDPRRPT